MAASLRVWASIGAFAAPPSATALPSASRRSVPGAPPAWSARRGRFGSVWSLIPLVPGVLPAAVVFVGSALSPMPVVVRTPPAGALPAVGGQPDGPCIWVFAMKVLHRGKRPRTERAARRVRIPPRLTQRRGLRPRRIPPFSGDVRAARRPVFSRRAAGAPGARPSPATAACRPAPARPRRCRGLPLRWPRRPAARPSR